VTLADAQGATMNADTMKVTLLSGDGEGRAELLEVPTGTSLGVFLSDFAKVELREGLSIRVRRDNVSSSLDLSAPLHDGDRVAVAPSEVTGAAWVPNLRDFRKYLGLIGFRFAKSGPGDHEIWQNDEGRKLTVNAANTDRKQTDIACIRGVAQFLGTSFGGAIDNIRSRLEL
jgi:hypothetical protein